MKRLARAWRSPWVCAVGSLLLGSVVVCCLAGMSPPGSRLLEGVPEEALTSSATLLPQPGAKKYSAEELRKRYPFQSLTARLAYEKDRKVEKPKLSDAAEHRLTKVEIIYTPAGWFNLRSESLRQLHSDEVEKFIAQDGFGVGRMPSPSPEFLILAEAPPIPFTASCARPLAPREQGPKMTLAKSETKAEAEGRQETLMPSLARLDSLHFSGLNEFVAPGSLGYIKDREHVAGFQSHQFRAMPELNEPPPRRRELPKEKWVIERLELVSLLKHDKPAVYISEELPRMDHLQKARTRPLDEFESAGLKQLQKGKDIATEASLNHIRMMGSLRAAKKCLECHTGERGELLGCFSYRMQRVPPRTPVE